MKIALLVVAVFGLWGALAVAVERLSPQNPRRLERMEEVMNDGAQTSLRLFGLGVVSVVVVFVVAVACAWL